MIREREKVYTIQDVDPVLQLPGKHIEDMLKLQERIEYVGQKMVSVSMRLTPDKVLSNNPITMEDQIIRKLELEERWHKSHAKYEKACSAVIDLLAKANLTEREREIAIYRWCENHTVTETAKRYGVTERQMYKVCSGIKLAIIEYWYENNGGE